MHKYDILKCMTQEDSSANKKKIVIFDKDTLFEQTDGKFDVTGHASDLESAVKLLLAIKMGEVAVPDVIVTAGTLNDTKEYIAHPIIEIQSGEAQTSDLISRKAKHTTTYHYLLPIVDEEGNVSLPKAHSADSKFLDPRTKDKFHQGYLRQPGNVSLSGFVIAHLANELLADKNIKVIGHSSGYFGQGVPIDAFVLKGSDEPHSLSEAIQLLLSS
jgi:hypothetical protein